MIRYFIPLLFFAVLVAFLARGLYLDPREIPSPLIDKSIPEFSLPVLGTDERMLGKDQLIGKPFILNVFASWCAPCLVEHPILLSLSKKNMIDVYGLNYKDNKKAAINWLLRHGNPYDLVLVDTKGLVSIDFGVYGVPETFIVDSFGIVKFKHVGPLTKEVVNSEMIPLVKGLN